MKQFMNEKGKLFGLINPLDLVVILLIFVLGIKVLSDFRPVPLRIIRHPVAIGILVKNVPPYIMKSIALKQDLFQDRTNTYLGKVIKITAGPAEIVVKENGKFVLKKAPRNLDLRLELRRNGEVFTNESKYGIYLGKLAVRVGDILHGHTLYTSLKGEIEYLKHGASRP